MVRSSRSAEQEGRSGIRIRSLSRRQANKKGMPIYSKEDIREQYCINSKELDFFEDGAYESSAHSRVFGCLSSSNLFLSDTNQGTVSPCNKSSFLPDCVKRFNFGSSTHDSRKSGGSGQGRRRKKKDGGKPEDGDDSDGGFKKQRPKPRICFIESQNKQSPVRGHFSPPPAYGGQSAVDPYRGRESITPQSMNQRTLSQEALHAHQGQVYTAQSQIGMSSCAQLQSALYNPNCGQCRASKENSVRFCIKNPEEGGRRRSSTGSSSARWQLGGRAAQVGPAPSAHMQLSQTAPSKVEGIQQISSSQYLSGQCNQYACVQQPGPFIQQGQPVSLQQHAHYHQHYYAHPGARLVTRSPSIQSLTGQAMGQQQVVTPIGQERVRLVGQVMTPIGQEVRIVTSQCPIHKFPSGGQQVTILPPYDPVNQTFARYYYYYRPLSSRVSFLHLVLGFFTLSSRVSFLLFPGKFRKNQWE